MEAAAKVVGFTVCCEVWVWVWWVGGWGARVKMGEREDEVKFAVF